MQRAIFHQLKCPGQEPNVHQEPNIVPKTFVALNVSKSQTETKAME
jgi:hypothetical protein